MVFTTRLSQGKKGADTRNLFETELHRLNVVQKNSTPGHPEPKKNPKSSYIRFAAAMPNETWQADFTHYRLRRLDGRPGADTEILTWLDDCSRYALSVTAHHRVTGPVVLATFRQTVAEHGIPASTLTDGMVYTVRLAGIGRQGGRNGFEQQLRAWHVVQKNSRPNQCEAFRCASAGLAWVSLGVVGLHLLEPCFDLADPEPELAADTESARAAALAAQVVQGLEADTELRSEFRQGDDRAEPRLGV